MFSSLARKVAWTVLAAAVAFLSAQAAAARTREEARAILAVKMKNGIARLGSGQEAQVHLTLFDQSVLLGFIRESGEHEFELVSPETELGRTVDYVEIEQLRGQNSTTGIRVSIGEKNQPFKTLIRLARRPLPGVGRGRAASNEYLSKPAVVFLVVLAIGVILIGVELGKA